MNDKIRDILNILLLPFNDLEFFYRGIDNQVDLYYISEISNNKNLDEIELLLKKYYNIDEEDKFGDREKEDKRLIRYYENLGKIATSFISHRNGKIVYKYWENEIDDQFIGPYKEYKKVEVFRKLNSLIATDLFPIIYLIKNDFEDIEQLDGNFSNIVLGDAQLYSLLNRGVAENHFHGNSGFNFFLVWEQIMNGRIPNKELEKIEYLNVGKGKFKSNATEYLLLARAIRNIIIFFLREKEDRRNFLDIINEWDEDKDEFNIRKEFIELLENKEFLSKECKEDNRLVDFIEKLNENKFIIEDDEKSDLTFKVFKECRNIKTFGENIFLFKAFWEYEKNRDNYLFKLLLKYIIIKNEFYKQIVQSNTLKGLDNFSNIFNRSTSFMGKIGLNNKNYYKKLFRAIFQNEHLKRIELRFSVCKKEYEFKEEFYSILRAYKEVIDEDFKTNKNSNVDFPRIGIVYHLIKMQDKKINKKCWINFKKENKSENIHFGEIQEGYFRLLKNLNSFRREHPYISYFILGLDAANVENYTPVNIFAPIYKQARGSNIDTLVGKNNDGDYIKVKNLNFTFHAGEDFRHLLSGLRRVSELIENCKFHAGDRIGHGIALGLDIEKWIDSNPVVIIPRGEHLDNLLWVWKRYSESISKNVAINLFLEAEIYKIAKEIFRDVSGINTAMLYETYKLRFNEFKNEYRDYSMKEDFIGREVNEFFCVKVKNNEGCIWNSEKLLHAYQCVCYLKKLEEPIYIKSDDIYKEMIEEVRSSLQKELAIKGIVVEVNPSSNAAIGEMDTIFESQAYIINDVNDLSNKNIMININADNPMILNTNVSNEYAYLYYGLLDRGVGREKALEWIDKQRKSGMETSFLDKKLSNAEYYSYLEELVKSYNGRCN